MNYQLSLDFVCEHHCEQFLHALWLLCVPESTQGVFLYVLMLRLKVLLKQEIKLFPSAVS